ncbi:MAG: ATP-binding cassette domain-containing protein [Clostridiales bacterium]|jgi:iron(III) transport system ATP-binding protein|nr:ATP-binding cassette domain-containing protein [Clostridiales bacterium]
MPDIVLTNVTKKWDRFYAVDNLNLVIDDNAFVTLLGPSGCGKTTTLRMIAGLETPTSGRITIGGTTVFDSEAGINVPANKRRVGFLFQNYALWPNMTVYKNIAFGLSNIKEDLPVIDDGALAAAGQLRVLENLPDMLKIIEESKDKSGKIDADKAALHLIDGFEISAGSAKDLLNLRIHESLEPNSVAAAKADKLRAELEAARKKHAASGHVLNERFELVKDGKVLTKTRKLSAEEIDLKVRKVARIVKIGMFMDRYPSELSGGQQQRVAIARTLAPEPSVLFMDEPLSNLDAKLRLEMRSELQRLHIDTGSTFIYVTHDQMEAMTLASKICLINNGVLQQYAAPLDVYNKPVNLFAADFVGSPAINFIQASGTGQNGASTALSVLDGIKAVFTPNGAEIEKAPEVIQAPDKSNKDVVFRPNIPNVEYTDEAARVAEDAEYILGVRPEYIRIDGKSGIEGEIYSSMPTGMETTVRIRVGNHLLTGVVFGGVLYRIGQRVRVSFETDGIILFDGKGGGMIAQGSLSI